MEPIASRPAFRFSVAPMMEWTDRHCRFFHRLLTRRALLYTEMLTTGAVIHGDREALLGFDPQERPVAMQLGGSEPGELAKAARIAADWGYCEINLNVGCPSDRVQSGRFGACLMRDPDLVGTLVAAVKDAVDVPVTVKCRLGVDEQDTERALDALADAALAAGADRLIVHARKAWLEGLSPKQNRDVPPLDYARVHRLKARLPHVDIVLNGGLATLDEATAHLDRLDGVMLGRAAYHEPYMLAEVDRRVFGEATPAPYRHDVAIALLDYIEKEMTRGTRLHAMTRHILGLFHGQPGARAWRRIITVEGVKPDAGPAVVERALAATRSAGAVAAA